MTAENDRYLHRMNLFAALATTFVVAVGYGGHRLNEHLKARDAQAAQDAATALRDEARARIPQYIKDDVARHCTGERLGNLMLTELCNDARRAQSYAIDAELERARIQRDVPQGAVAEQVDAGGGATRYLPRVEESAISQERAPN